MGKKRMDEMRLTDRNDFSAAAQLVDPENDYNRLGFGTAILFVRGEAYVFIHGEHVSTAPEYNIIQGWETVTESSRGMMIIENLRVERTLHGRRSGLQWQSGGANAF